MGWVVAILFAIVLVWLLKPAKKPPVVAQVPSKTMAPDEEVIGEDSVRVTYSSDEHEWRESRIKDLLRDLETPYGYWTFANVPQQLEREMTGLLDRDPRNAVALSLKARLPRIQRECATQFALVRVRDLQERAETAATVGTKQKYAREALQVIDSSLAGGLADAAMLTPKVSQLKHFIAQVAIDSFKEKASRFEFKGNLKKALEYYQDALYSALNDDVDDAEQESSIRELTEKVEALTDQLRQQAEEKKAKKKPDAAMDVT